MYLSLCANINISSLLLSKYLGVVFLGHIVNVLLTLKEVSEVFQWLFCYSTPPPGFLLLCTPIDTWYYHYQHVESSQASDWTLVLCNGRRILNHWTTREVPQIDLSCISSKAFFLFIMVGLSNFLNIHQVYFTLTAKSLIFTRVPP